MNVKVLSNLASKMGPKMGKLMLKARKYSPELCLIGGGVAIVIGVVVACKETLNVEPILDEGNARKEELDNLTKDGVYTETDCRRDKAIVSVHTGVRLVRNYVPAVLLVGGGLGLIFTSYRILKVRNVALASAYAGLSDAFQKYRERVKLDAGDDKDMEYMYGTKAEKMKITNENGKKETVVENVLPEGSEKKYSLLARVFDESSCNFEKSNTSNRIFLHTTLQDLNNRLRARGYLLLNEAYEALGFDSTTEGCVLGWVMGEGRHNCVDFGMWDTSREKVRDFINGSERYIILDFNIDGIVYDLIDKKNEMRKMGMARY